jgi:hypothetical protein
MVKIGTNLRGKPRHQIARLRHGSRKKIRKTQDQQRSPVVKSKKAKKQKSKQAHKVLLFRELCGWV